ncbi:hypothetical protein Syun_026114 [Stephania yunnanensis]|uniref:pectinesterase n=1 Tax=Stephania yunnanensis TaxID=152371 RepID=A0AAP0F1S8_9MAGN
MAERAALLVTIIVLVIIQLVPTIDAALNSTLVAVEKSVKVITVRKDGSGDFKSIREANFAPKLDVWSLNEEQAVAMRMSGDKVIFYNCKFLGYKDTLCDYKGNHLFQNCYIEGAVDFIFENGISHHLFHVPRRKSRRGHGLHNMDECVDPYPPIGLGLHSATRLFVSSRGHDPMASLAM